MDTKTASDETTTRNGGARATRRNAWIVAGLALIAATNAKSPAGALASEIVAPSATANDGTALMQRVAVAYEANVSGVLAVRSHSDLAIKAPIFGRHIVDDTWYVFENGNLAASSRKADPRRPPLHDPYRMAYLAEYTYRLAPCSSCAAGTSAIQYESTTRDVAHAHGTFVVNTNTAHILRGSETPYKLPWPTKSGELDATWAEVPGGWFPVKVDGAFVGNIGPFVGRAFYSQANTTIERYPSVSAATASLVAQTGLAAAPTDAPTTPSDVAVEKATDAR